MNRPDQFIIRTPDELYEELFHAIQMSGIFPDSKTFVDCDPKASPADILVQYRKQSQNENFDLQVFVAKFFEPPYSYSTGFLSSDKWSASEHINALWPMLARTSDQPREGSSLIPLPYPYIVPGGRFGEIYYWDSYFTMLGLLISEEKEMAVNMLKNFAFLIDAVGFIPNGNRSYFCSRSQPPFFSLMVELIADQIDQNFRVEFLPQMLKEYRFWMSGANEIIGDKGEALRVVKIVSGDTLNRYWDNLESPRQESYQEDVHMLDDANGLTNILFRNIRAACESGWDFSSRWLRNVEELKEIETTRIIPVDLNCLLFHLEKTISKAYSEVRDAEGQKRFIALAESRKKAIQTHCWNEKQQVYEDYHIDYGKTTGRKSLAMVFPLFFNIASQKQAEKIAMILDVDFLKKGGFVTTPYNTGQQWDAPNGWAPLQWIAVKGLINYGFKSLASDAAKRWINLCDHVYKSSGKFVEKYNVEQSNLEAGGGEYPVQDGFGWSNGVYLRMLQFIKSLK